MAPTSWSRESVLGALVWLVALALPAAALAGPPPAAPGMSAVATGHSRIYLIADRWAEVRAGGVSFDAVAPFSTLEAADADGALVGTSSETSDGLAAVARAGGVSWSVSGPAIWYAPPFWWQGLDFPRAVVDVTNDVNPTVPLGDSHVTAYRDDGSAWFDHVFRARWVEPRFSGEGCFVSVVQNGAGRHGVQIRSAVGVHTLWFGGFIHDVAVSPDARRLLVLSAADSGDHREQLTWVRLSASGTPTVMHVTQRRLHHYAATFSPDGRHVVLWGFRAQVVRFGQSCGGWRLPYEWCTEAAFSHGRLYALCEYQQVSPGGTQTIIKASIFDWRAGHPLWSADQPDTDTITCDPGFHQVLLGKHLYDGLPVEWTVVDVAGGGSAALGAPGDYLGARLVGGGEAAVLKPDGSCAWITSPTF